MNWRSSSVSSDDGDTMSRSPSESTDKPRSRRHDKGVISEHHRIVVGAPRIPEVRNIRNMGI
jgi:hypothetical protein